MPYFTHAESQRQRERNQKNKPWLYNKGTKTPEGLRRSSRNAMKPETLRKEQFKKFLIRTKKGLAVTKRILDHLDSGGSVPAETMKILDEWMTEFNLTEDEDNFLKIGSEKVRNYLPANWHN